MAPSLLIAIVTSRSTNMAATQISDDLLEDHVKVGIEKWQKGELFMSIGVSESDPILEPGASLPDKNDKKHPFHKFLEAVASDITQGFALDRNEKKSILRRLQDKSEKWKELVASKSEQIKTTPTPKKKKNKKEDTPMDDPLEESSSSQTVGEQSQLAEAATPAAAKKMLDTNLERKKRIFEEARDMIMADVPDSTKESFGQIYFSKWGKQFLPCLVMNPYSVPPGGVRDMWLDMYDKVRNTKRRQGLSVPRRYLLSHRSLNFHSNPTIGESSEPACFHDKLGVSTES